METPRKFTIAKLSTRKFGSSSVLKIMQYINTISTDEDPSLRIESFAMVNLRGVSTKLYFNGDYVVVKYIIILFICILNSDWSICLLITSYKYSYTYLLNLLNWFKLEITLGACALLSKFLNNGCSLY